MFWSRSKKYPQKSFPEFFSLEENGNKQENDKISYIVNNFVDGVLIFDRKNRLSFVNTQAEKILGIEKAKILGKDMMKLSHFLPLKPLVSLLGGDIREISKKQIEIQAGKFLEISSVPVYSETGKIGALVILRDITKEKMLDMMKSEFITLAAHQLRTPTSAIKWSLRMLLDGDVGEVTEEQKKVIERAYQTNDKVIGLINDLLDVTKIEEGRFLSKMALCSVEDIISQVLDIYSYEINKREIEVIFEKEENLPKIMLDFEKIKMAFGNIFENSLRYNSKGGKINILARKNEENIEIQIKDNGLGIPDKEKDKIGSRFFRGEKAIKVETEGSGLGIFIAKNIIESHGGKVWFDSKEGKGSVFYFTLPVKREFAEYLTGEFY